MSIIDKIHDKLDQIDDALTSYRGALKWKHIGPDQVNHLNERIKTLERRQKQLTDKLYMIENCEHGDVEDTGGPGGSQVCLSCGLVR